MKGPFVLLLIVASGVVGASIVGAQDPEKKPEAAALTPFPGGYLDHSALSDALRMVAEAHPDVVGLNSLAKSKEGRDVWMVTIGPASKGAPPKPSVLVVANLEADHLVGSQVALGLIERLASGDEKSLEGRTLYIVPRLNPDGAERMLKGSPRFDFRTNLTSLDRDRDGKSGEDGPNDLDGDGLALSMRVKDAKATLIPDAKDPRILRKADPAKGEYPVYSETSEGLDDDSDGAIDEDPPGGTNLNRNWPHNWSEFQPETGVAPAIEPEVNALIRFAFAHPEIAAVWSFGLNDNLKGEAKGYAGPDTPIMTELIRLFGVANTRKAEAADAAKAKEAEKAAKEKEEATKKDEKPAPPAEAPQAKAQTRGGRGGPRRGGAAPSPSSAPTPGLEATTDGALSEWAYHQFGVIGLASRLWPRPEGQPGGTSPTGEGDARWFDWNDKVMNGSAFVPFHPFEHPTLGAVEVGGWKPGVRLNPPIEQVGAIVETHLAFLKDLAGRLPILAFAEAKAEAKGGGVFEIKATIENTGILPTALAQGLTTRKAPPVLVKLTLGDAKLLSGRALTQVDTLGGSGGLREVRWLILAPVGMKSITLEATCPRAGSARQEVNLP
ncbi:M14 family metallopeptidase [Tundrisphaera lichenicola]|uniref:M14 family metallopeptidase n=1 Tax=Tundrisphaera lichenicola TaxID=2029860 RepID=UPI003EC081F3